MIEDVRLLTLEDVKGYLRVEHNKEDILIETMLEAAKSTVLNYLGVEDFDYYTHYYDEYGNIIKDRTIPKEFVIACLMLCGHWYERRELMTGKYEQGKQIPFGFEMLLSPHRHFMKGVEMM